MATPVTTGVEATVSVDSALDNLKVAYPDLRSLRGAKREAVKDARYHLEQARRLLKRAELL